MEWEKICKGMDRGKRIGSNFAKKQVGDIEKDSSPQRETRKIILTIKTTYANGNTEDTKPNYKTNNNNDNT